MHDKKKVLITGKGSYVGEAVKVCLDSSRDEFIVDTLDMLCDDWRNHSFAGYDAIFHVAGIVHQKKASAELYYAVNRDLAIETAKKAKAEGVRLFVFMSTLAVYGRKDVMGKKNEITTQTQPLPISHYGKSKLEAEKGIQELEDDCFKVCILRPPMIYGDNCPGNYATLKKLTLKFGIVPTMDNERSMAHISVICEFVKQCITDEKSGVFCPQNQEYMSTAQLMKEIAQDNERQYRESRLFALGIKVGAIFMPQFRKSFGNLTYTRDDDIGESEKTTNSCNTNAKSQTHSRKPYVWIINHNAIPPGLGGLNRHYYFSKYLGRLGYDVKIFSSSRIHNTDVNMIDDGSLYQVRDWRSVEYVFVRSTDYRGNGIKRIINLLSFMFNVKKACKFFDKPDVIYASSPDIFGAVAALQIAQRLRLPFIFEVRDLWPEAIVAFNGTSPRHPAIIVINALAKWLYKKADAIIFTMAGAKQYLRDKGWDKIIREDKIYFINNGVDIEEFDDLKNRKPMDSSHNQSYDFVYAGSMRRMNNIELLLESAKQINKHCPDVRLLLYGQGDDNNALKQKAINEGIDNIAFMGMVSKNDIPQILSNAYALILHYKDADIWKYGSSQNKLFEYLAAGKPILSTMQSGYSISISSVGEVANSYTPEDIASAVERIRNYSSEQYERVCKNARIAAAEFDYKILANNLRIIIDNTIRVSQKRGL